MKQCLFKDRYTVQMEMKQCLFECRCSYHNIIVVADVTGLAVVIEIAATNGVFITRIYW